jgi:hypothetical protein
VAQVQIFQGEQLDAFADELKVPEPQDVQARSLVEVPAVETYLPAAQVVHAVQLETFVVLL